MRLNLGQKLWNEALEIRNDAGNIKWHSNLIWVGSGDTGWKITFLVNQLYLNTKRTHKDTYIYVTNINFLYLNLTTAELYSDSQGRISSFWPLGGMTDWQCVAFYFSCIADLVKRAFGSKFRWNGLLIAKRCNMCRKGFISQKTLAHTLTYIHLFLLSVDFNPLMALKP